MIVSIPALGEVSDYWEAGASKKLGREGSRGDEPARFPGDH
jgi:hypothetical protein